MDDPKSGFDAENLEQTKDPEAQSFNRKNLFLLTCLSLFALTIKDIYGA